MSKHNLFTTLLSLITFFPAIAFSDPPTGWLDLVTQGQIAGWAKDPDYDGPIRVHIYIDGALVKSLVASDFRTDVGSHGYNWAPYPFGPGRHKVIVYAIGVNSSGLPDDQNPPLLGTPKFLEAECFGMSGDVLAWCGVRDYWENRQFDVKMIGNDFVRVGVNQSFGGTIFQLYDDDWDNNLISEHGGGAML